MLSLMSSPAEKHIGSDTNPIGCNVKWEGKDAHWMPADACDLILLDFLWCKPGHYPAVAFPAIDYTVM